MQLRQLLKVALTAITLSCFITAPTIQAKTLIVGLSPFQTSDLHKSNLQKLLAYLCHQSEFSQAIFYDAYRLKTLGHFRIPEKKGLQSSKAILKHNRKLISSLLRFGENQKINIPITALPKTIGAIRFPQFSYFVAEQFNQGRHTLLIIGSPVYDSPNDKAFSMVGNLYPSDAHILASRKISVFGTKDSPKSLSGWTVHWINTDSKTNSSQYQYALERFWRLYVKNKSGQLQRIASDIQSVLAGLNHLPDNLDHSVSIDTSARLEMIRLRQQDLIINESKPAVSGSNIKTKIVSNPQNAQNTEVTLSWECSHCDLDLYVRMNNKHNQDQQPVLYFGNTETINGTFYKSISDLSAVNKGFETVVFKTPIDLTSLDIAVNFYSGFSSKGIQARLTFHYNGVTKHHHFNLNARQGNRISDPHKVLEASETNGHIYKLKPSNLLTYKQGSGDE